MRLVTALLLFGCSGRTDLLAVSGEGPGCDAPIRLGDQCAGALAAKRLRRALCTCSPLVLERGLFTQGGSGMRGAPPAAVGSDDYIQIAGPVQVGGALEAAGSYGISFGRSAGVLGNLRSAGTLATNQFLGVAGDAFVDGDVLGRMDIGGALHVPYDVFISTSVTASDLIIEPVMVPPPCDCAASPIDVAALAAKHSQLNDNKRIGLSSDLFVGANGPKALDLPCGEFYLSQLTSNVELELRVHGRAALYVGGEVFFGMGMFVTLDPKAELDLIVAGDFTSSPEGVVGTRGAPPVRLWIGGSTVKLGGYATLSLAVHAPNAVVYSDVGIDINGSLLAGALSLPGDVGVNFDEEILNAGASCGEPPEKPVE